MYDNIIIIMSQSSLTILPNESFISNQNDIDIDIIENVTVICV